LQMSLQFSKASKDKERLNSCCSMEAY
jgi:hypothetical protein